MMRETVPARPYRGVAPDERRAQRRNRLIEAAIAVYGERGYRQATVKAVCEAAGLTERYFYESFLNSEELLIASFNTVSLAIFEEVSAAAREAGRSRKARARAMLASYFAVLQREPRSARLCLVEMRGVSREVEEAFDSVVRVMGREVAKIVSRPELQDDELLQAGVVGGVIQIALRWIQQDCTPALEEVTETALKLGMVLASSR